MARKALKEKMLTVPEVKQLLEAIGDDNLDQFQRRALDYASKFSKVDQGAATDLVQGLVQTFEFEEEEAVQVVSSMPESIAELRAFLGGGRKIVETQKLDAILEFLNQHRKKE
jgi:DNA-directed RNA polymerase subunit F